MRGEMRSLLLSRDRAAIGWPRCDEPRGRSQSVSTGPATDLARFVREFFLPEDTRVEEESAGGTSGPFEENQREVRSVISLSQRSQRSLFIILTVFVCWKQFFLEFINNIIFVVLILIYEYLITYILPER